MLTDRRNFELLRNDLSDAANIESFSLYYIRSRAVTTFAIVAIYLAIRSPQKGPMIIVVRQFQLLCVRPFSNFLLSSRPRIQVRAP